MSSLSAAVVGVDDSAVFRPAVLRANREGGGRALPPALKFHALCHTYASLCVAAGIPPLEIARFMVHAKVTTTLSVSAHLFEDDHADAMSALAAMSAPATAENVVRLQRVEPKLQRRQRALTVLFETLSSTSRSAR